MTKSDVVQSQFGGELLAYNSNKLQYVARARITKAPSQRIRIFLKMYIYLSGLGFHSHVAGVFGGTGLFENGVQGGDFWKLRVNVVVWTAKMYL